VSRRAYYILDCGSDAIDFRRKRDAVRAARQVSRGTGMVLTVGLRFEQAPPTWCKVYGVLDDAHFPVIELEPVGGDTK
jgi:hypothetical protein